MCYKLQGLYVHIHILTLKKASINAHVIFSSHAAGACQMSPYSISSQLISSIGAVKYI